MNYTTKNEKETIKLGIQLASTLKGADIIALYGELGSGKTTFVKGLAQGLKIKENITSPTFTLMNIYKMGKCNVLCHIDTYRLKNKKELLAIGAQDYIGQKNVITVIEWPKKASQLLKGKKIIKVNIKYNKMHRRTLVIASQSEARARQSR